MDPSPSLYERVLRHQAGLATKQDLKLALAPLGAGMRALKWMAAVNILGTLALIGLVTALVMKVVE